MLVGASRERVATELVYFALWCADNTETTFDSIKTYQKEAAALLEVWGGHKVEVGRKEVWVMKRMKHERCARVMRKRALSASMLRKWRARLERKKGAREDEWAAFRAMSTAFYGLLRASEVVGRKGKHVGLRWRNVRFVKDTKGKLVHVELWVERSKTDVWGFGAKVFIYAEKGEGSNPVEDLWVVYEAAKRAAGFSEDDPVFTQQGGKNGEPVQMTYQKLNKLFKAAMQAEGEDPAAYGTHSARRGGATAMYLAGCSGDDIQAAGRWASDCYKRYIEATPAERKNWAQGMAKAKQVEWVYSWEELAKGA